MKVNIVVLGAMQCNISLNQFDIMKALPFVDISKYFSQWPLQIVLVLAYPLWALKIQYHVHPDGMEARNQSNADVDNNIASCMMIWPDPYMHRGCAYLLQSYNNSLNLITRNMCGDQISQLWISFTKVTYDRSLAVDMSSIHSVYTISNTRLRSNACLLSELVETLLHCTLLHKSDFIKPGVNVSI